MPTKPNPDIVIPSDPEAAVGDDIVGAILGLHPSTIKWRRTTRSGELPPCFRIGRTVRYILKDVLAFRAERMQKPASAA
jgi:hypothetical protein